jgi:hypothetical protein
MQQDKEGIAILVSLKKINSQVFRKKKKTKIKII